MGRSNVGKSSFLCSLTNQKGLAKVSATPGKTRLINYFLVDESWYLVDLPGYGYAKVSKAEQERWGQALEEFLLKREALKLGILLIDCRHEPKDQDMQMYDWLAQRSYPTLLVLTKCDKISKNKIAAAIATFAKTTGHPASDIIAFSAETGMGRNQVLQALGQIVRK